MKRPGSRRNGDVVFNYKMYIAGEGVVTPCLRQKAKNVSPFLPESNFVAGFCSGKSLITNSCSVNGYKHIYEKRYKIIVGSATDRRRFLLYCR
jgi:hypothetical protein